MGGDPPVLCCFIVDVVVAVVVGLTVNLRLVGVRGASGSRSGSSSDDWLDLNGCLAQSGDTFTDVICSTILNSL